MRWQHWLLVATIALGLVGPAWAGPFSFLRKNRQQAETPPPAQAQPQVAELIVALKSDSEAARRAAAAEELRQHDAKAYPEIVPALIESAQRDAKPEVRQAAVQSLGRIRPVSVEVGRVIEQVASGDSVMRVRLVARSTLAQYQMAGYRSGNPPAGPIQPGTTQEPPLAEPQDVPVLNPPPTATVDVPSSPQPYAQPMPKGPPSYTPPASVPQAPRLTPVPTRPSSTSNYVPPDGPALPGGTPLSSYRLIQPPHRFPDNVNAPPVTPAPVAEPSVPVKPVMASPVSMPVVKPQQESGPMLNGPQ